MTHDAPADRAIDRFYELKEADPRHCSYGIMLVQNMMYRVTVESVSRSGKSVQFRCDGKLGTARRDVTGEWQDESEPHWPIRFIAQPDPQTPPEK